MPNHPDTIVWNISKKCNLNCEFCFGPELNGKEISTDEAMATIKNLAKRDFKRIVFTGGEPTLRSDLDDLITYAKKEGLYTILHTNGFALDAGFLHRVELWLDQINLPLDGYDQKTHEIMRGEGHFDKVMTKLEDLKDYKYVVVVSTVATAKNKDIISKIGPVLPDCVDKWRIFQFNPRGKAAGAAKDFEIAVKDFEAIREKIDDEMLICDVQFVPGDDQDFFESYHLLD